MSEADELLERLAGGVSAYTADPSTEPHIIIDSDRNVIVPEALRRIAVQHDHNIETVTFDCPRYWDGHDMSQMAVFVNYLRSDGYTDSCPCTNVVVDTTDSSMMHFNWSISGNVTAAQGFLSFLVCIKKTDANGYLSNHWNSELSTEELYVSEGLECEESAATRYPDVIAQLLLRVDALEKNGGGGSGGSGANVFIGTRDEYEARYASGNVAVGTIVIITDEDGPTSNGGSSVLGEAVLGEMILG